jgi:8-oxo-dGTP diphosphatase
MAFDDLFRVSAHAVLTNADNKVLLVKATYGTFGWGLPGGSIDPGETIHETVVRECREELDVEIDILYLSGVYYHSKYNSHSCVFRATMPKDSTIILSPEHSEYGYFTVDEMSEVQRHRVLECLHFDGHVKSAKF